MPHRGEPARFVVPITSISSSSSVPATTDSSSPPPADVEAGESKFGPATKVSLSDEAREAMMVDISEMFPIPAEVPDPVIELDELDVPRAARENAEATERSTAALGRKLSSVLG